jgi:Tfp pilus assembly protein PilN
VSTLDRTPEVAAEPSPAPPSPAAAAAAPAVRLERMEPLNLARRPFLNSRPVVRVSLLLWALGLLILLGNVSLFWSYLSSSADKRQQVARGQDEIARQQRGASQLQSRLDSIDLERQNEQIDFLNQKIEERTFSWSLLLDRLAEVLPNDVRLTRLSPQTERTGVETRRPRTAPGTSRPRREGQVPLFITGETRNDEALLRFVDNLFAHPAFADPNLIREEREENDLVRFELSVQYIPGGPPPGAAAETPTIEEAPAPGNPEPAAPAPPAATRPSPAPRGGGRP